MLNKKHCDINYTPKNKHKKPILPLLLFPRKVKNAIKAPPPTKQQKTLSRKWYRKNKHKSQLCYCGCHFKQAENAIESHNIICCSITKFRRCRDDYGLCYYGWVTAATVCWCRHIAVVQSCDPSRWVRPNPRRMESVIDNCTTGL